MYTEAHRQLPHRQVGGGGEGELTEEEEEESRHRLLSASSNNSSRRTGLLWTSAATPSSKPDGSPLSNTGAGAGGADTADTAISRGRRRHGSSGSFVQDLSMLARVFLLRGLFVGRRWVFPLLLTCTSAGYEVAASTILSVIGDFYLAISSMDAHLFLQVLWRSLLVVTVVAVLKAVRDLSKEACALVWRQGLVSFLHSWYLRGKMPYVLSTGEAGRTKGGGGGDAASYGISGRGGGISGSGWGRGSGSGSGSGSGGGSGWGSGNGNAGASTVRRVRGSGSGGRKETTAARPVDNPDQRVTADASALTTAFASVVQATLVVPGLVFFYTWYLVGMFGWVAPAACYAYFIVASAANWAVVKKVVPAVYRQQRAEGTFRYDHAWLRTHSESVVFCGVEAVEGRERDRLGASFDAVVTASWSVIKSHVPLYVLTQFFDYLGSIINYAAVGGAILYLSKADGKGEAEIAALVARGSYSCLYLIDAFSQALRASEAASRVGGSAERVAELLRATGFSDSDAEALEPWSTELPTHTPSRGHGIGGGDSRRGRRRPRGGGRGAGGGAPSVRRLSAGVRRGAEGGGDGGGVERGSGSGSGSSGSLTATIRSRLGWGRGGLASLEEEEEEEEEEEGEGETMERGRREGGPGREVNGDGEFQHSAAGGYRPPAVAAVTAAAAATGSGGGAGGGSDTRECKSSEAQEEAPGGGGGGGGPDSGGNVRANASSSGELLTGCSSTEAEGKAEDEDEDGAFVGAFVGAIASGGGGDDDDGSGGAGGGGDGGGSGVGVAVPDSASEPAPANSKEERPEREGAVCDDWLLKVEGYTVAQPRQRRVRFGGGRYNDSDGDDDDEFYGSGIDGDGTSGRVGTLAAAGCVIGSGGRGRSGGGVTASSSASAGEQGAEKVGMIVRELRLTVHRGHNLLITGPSGCGKTSLLRSIAGLWEASAGTLDLCPRVEACRRAHEVRGTTAVAGPWRSSAAGGDCFEAGGGGGILFVPQRSYCFRGTLVEQVTYPASADDASVVTVTGILSALGLSHLVSLDLDGIGRDEYPESSGGGGGGDGDARAPTGSNGSIFCASGNAMNAFARWRFGSTSSASAAAHAEGGGGGTSNFSSGFRGGISSSSARRRNRSGSSGGGGGSLNRGGTRSTEDVDMVDEECSPTSPLIPSTATGTTASSSSSRGSFSSSSAASFGGLPRPHRGSRNGVTHEGGVTGGHGNNDERRRQRSSSGSSSSNNNSGGGSSSGSSSSSSSSRIMMPNNSPGMLSDEHSAIVAAAATAAAASGRQHGGSVREIGVQRLRDIGLWWQQQKRQPQQHHRPPQQLEEGEEDRETWPGRSNRMRGRRRRQQRQRDWASVLSVGEQQRLGIARVLYHRPALAFLDEATSAVTEEAERDAYRLMRDAGVTVVAVGHRTSLRALHERVLALGGAPDGEWELSGIASGTEISGTEISSFLGNEDLLLSR